MESRDIRLEDGYGTRNEEGIDGGDLVVERVFYTLRGVEYEDSWGSGVGINCTGPSFVDTGGPTQTKCCDII